MTGKWKNFKVFSEKAKTSQSSDCFILNTVSRSPRIIPVEKLMHGMNKETSQKIEAQVLLHKLQEVTDEIAGTGGGHLLKPFQDMGLLAENFKLSKNLTTEKSESFKQSKAFQQLKCTA